jgi:hypothetical protein
MSTITKGEALSVEALAHELQQLEEMNLAQLRERFQELCGEETHSKNLPYLRKRLAARLQELGEEVASDVSEIQIEGQIPVHATEASHAESQVESLDEAEGLLSAPVDPEMESEKATQETREAMPKQGKGRPPKDAERDPRLPEPGEVLIRTYKGIDYLVEVLANGFNCEGHHYKSLSALASEITGHATNGFLFFGLGSKAVA